MIEKIVDWDLKPQYKTKKICPPAIFLYHLVIPKPINHDQSVKSEHISKNPN